MPHGVRAHSKLKIALSEILLSRICVHANTLAHAVDDNATMYASSSLHNGPISSALVISSTSFAEFGEQSNPSTCGRVIANL